MNKKDILNTLIQYYANGNKSKFANLLGITPQAISAWEKRNTFDVELVFTKCENINAHWLLSGEGEMLASEDSETLSSTKNDPLSEKLLLMLEKKDEVIRHQAEDIGKLREQIDQMRNKMQKIVDSANTEAIADVG